MEPGRQHDLFHSRRRNGGVKKSRRTVGAWADVPRASPGWVCGLAGGRGLAGSQGHRALSRYEIMMRMDRLSGIAVAIFLTCCPPASALNPSLDISQYAHKAWTVREGFFKGLISSIAQTPDG